MAVRIKAMSLDISEEALSVVEDVDEGSFNHKGIQDEGSVAWVTSFQGAVGTYLDLDDAFAVDPTVNPSRVLAMCTAMHASQSAIGLVAPMSGVNLAESCEGILVNLRVLETARNLNNRFI